MTESCVLCEGYHDRAFWKGLLEYLGCTDPGMSRDRSSRLPVFDPQGKEVRSGGQFGFRTREGGFVRVVPCHGAQNVVREGKIRLSRRAPPFRLVLSVDSDERVDGSVAVAATPGRQTVLTMAREIDPEAILSGNVVHFGDGSEICLIRWEAHDEANPGLPEQQTLERLVCSAIVAAYPDRGPVVRAWLDSRPGAPSVHHKEFAWSYMAGWYASQGCDDFYLGLWRDDRVATELMARLDASGAWAVAVSLAE